MRKILFLTFIVLSTTSCTKKPSPTFHRPDGGDTPTDTTVTVGEPLPEWQAGMLDIHAVNSARGECTFFILPDGTTMVVDAGDLYKQKSSSYANVPARPDINTQPYEVYARYIDHFMPSGHNRIDYVLVTHYHNDHFGDNGGGRSKDAEGGYVLMGVSGLYSKIPFGKIMDRTYPQYTGVEAAGTSTSEELPDYAAFVNYNVKNRGLVAEKFNVGSKDQIAMKYKPADYDCEVWNIAGNGVVWDGTKGVDFNEDKKLYENGLSCAFLLSYGAFDYFTSGDMNDGSTCSAAAKTIGRNIEAEKCLHHMSNASPFASQNSVFNSQVVVTQSFYVRKEQPQQSMVSLYAPQKDLFFTNIDESLTTESPAIYKDCKGINGHVVIRVAKDGGYFYVYMLDDSNYEYRVKSIHGPYICK